jgi:hypothetical protein
VDEPEELKYTFSAPRESAESILSEPGESEDDVFGSAGGNSLPIPKVPEMPPPPPPPAPLPVPVPRPAPAAYQPPMPVFHQPTPVPVMPTAPVAPVPAASDNPFSFGADSPSTAAPEPPQPRQARVRKGAPAHLPAPEPVEALPATEGVEDVPGEKPSRKKREADRERGRDKKRSNAAPAAGGVFLYLFIAAAGYGLLMTALAIYGLFFSGGERVDPGHPLSTIPDNFGEFDPVSRKKVGMKFPADGELPASQVAELGGKIEIGQLAIEPVKVESRPLKIVTEGLRSGADGHPETRQEVRGRAMVLQLRITNTSNEFSIYPLDPAFDRKARGDDQKPATRLVVGKQTFFGGAIEWPLGDKERVKRRYEEQQEKDWQPLKPGETRDYVVVSDTDPKITRAVRETSGMILWRVQVRRGLITFKQKDVPVTAVIGVEFKSSDLNQGE